MNTQTKLEFADIEDIDSFHWCYIGDAASKETQMGLEITCPDRRISIQLDRQIKKVAKYHNELIKMLKITLLESDSMNNKTIKDARDLINRIKNDV